MLRYPPSLPSPKHGNGVPANCDGHQHALQEMQECGYGNVLILVEFALKGHDDMTQIRTVLVVSLIFSSVLTGTAAALQISPPSSQQPQPAQIQQPAPPPVSVMLKKLV